MNLYRVVIEGGENFSESYVVADCTDEAYKMVRKFLDEKHIGLEADRRLKYIELVATEGYNLSVSSTMLYMKKSSTESTKDLNINLNE